jgi:hypothetical protein
MLGLLGQPAQLAAEDALTVVRTLAMALYTGPPGVKRGWRSLPLVPLLLMHSGFYFEAWLPRFQNWLSGIFDRFKHVAACLDAVHQAAPRPPRPPSPSSP